MNTVISECYCYPFAVKLDSCVGSCISNNLCVAKNMTKSKHVQHEYRNK